MIAQRRRVLRPSLHPRDDLGGRKRHPLAPELRQRMVVTRNRVDRGEGGAGTEQRLFQTFATPAGPRPVGRRRKCRRWIGQESRSGSHTEPYTATAFDATSIGKTAAPVNRI